MADNRLADYRLADHRLADHRLADHRLADHRKTSVLFKFLKLNRLQIEIFYSTAVLGDTVFVNTLYGEDQLVIPPGTSDGTVLELETLDPKHTFTVRIHIARSDKQTSWGYNLYRELQQEQQRVESVCRVVGYSTQSKGAMRRRELYRVTLLPQYLWIVSLLDKAYHRLNKIPWCKKTFQMFDSQDSYQSKGEPMAMSQI